MSKSRTYFRHAIKDMDQKVDKANLQFTVIHQEYDNAMEQISQNFQNYFMDSYRALNNSKIGSKRASIVSQTRNRFNDKRTIQHNVTGKRDSLLDINYKNTNNTTKRYLNVNQSRDSLKSSIDDRSKVPTSNISRKS